MLSAQVQSPSEPVENVNWLVEFMTTAGIPAVSSYGVCFGRGMTAVIAMVQDQLPADNNLHQSLHECHQNNIAPDSLQLAYLKTLQLFNDPSKHFFLPDAPLQHTQSTGVQVILDYLASGASCDYMRLDSKIYTLNSFTGAYSKASLPDYFNLLAHAAHNTSVILPYALPLLLSSNEHTVAVGYDLDTSKWSITDTSYLQTRYFEFSGEASAFIWRLFTKSSKSEYVTFSTRGFADDAGLEAVNKIWSAWRADPSFIQLHKVNAALSQNDKNRWLLTAVVDGDENSVAKLLAHGADANYRDERGHTPLSDAVANGRTAIVNQLFESSDINIDEAFGAASITPLYVAACNGWVRTVAALLGYGANADIAKPSDNETPLIAASRRSLTEVARILIPHSNVHLTNTLGLSALNYSAIYGRVDIVRDLLAANADPLQKANDGTTPLSAARYYLKNPSQYHKPDMMPRIQESIAIMEAHIKEQQRQAIKAIITTNTKPVSVANEALTHSTTRPILPVTVDPRMFQPVIVPPPGNTTNPGMLDDKNIYPAQ